MCAAQHTDQQSTPDGRRMPPGRSRLGGAAVRKQRTVRTAVTAAVTGIAVVLPLGSPALAQLNPVIVKRLDLDRATLGKVEAYDRYRTREADQRRRAKMALGFARKQIGKPYRWGATGPGGYDCSGLAMKSWRKAGVQLPRVTYSQYSAVKRKVRLKSLRPGDLIFFHGRSHVGLYVGNGRYLHAPNTGSRVRIDKLDAARRQQFAGAVRPGAPARRKWAPAVRELAGKIDRMAAQEKKAHKKPPDIMGETADFDEDLDSRKNPRIPVPLKAPAKAPGESATPADPPRKADGPGPRRPRHKAPRQAPSREAPSREAPIHEAPAENASPGDERPDAPAPRPRWDNDLDTAGFDDDSEPAPFNEHMSDSSDEED